MVRIKVIHQIRAVPIECMNSTDAAHERGLDKHQAIAEEVLREVNEETTRRDEQVPDGDSFSN
jgi:NTP pyrophosphatase (non-canonical NTP hydrolase)